MTSPSTSSICPNYKNSTFWNKQMNTSASPYTKIFHDPECKSCCCSGRFDERTQANNFNDMGQYRNYTVCYSNESIHSSNAMENRFLYDVNTSQNQVPEPREVFRSCDVDNTGTPRSELCYEKPIKKISNASCSMNINSPKERYQQKSYCKGVMKRKRKRTIFSTEQIVIMEGVFKKSPYVSREERLFLAQQLHINEKAIKIWFQNRRRVTEKTDKDQSDSYHSDSTVEEVPFDYNTRLAYIETQINQNTDEFGFVTLNSKVLTELVKLIDTALSRNIDCQDSSSENKNNDSYLMYEPVSPESLCGDNKDSENILKWEPSEPEESLKRLIDIHTVFYG